jgi:hypothetical protein
MLKQVTVSLRLFVNVFKYILAVSLTGRRVIVAGQMVRRGSGRHDSGVPGHLVRLWQRCTPLQSNGQISRQEI